VRYLPAMYRDHPGFFMMLFSAAMFHLAVGAFHILTPDAYEAPVYGYWHDVAPIWVWGVIHVTVWAVVTFGSYYYLIVARLGLAFALVLMLAKGFLLEAHGAPAGSAVPIYLFIAFCHFATLREPPTNPAAVRR